MKEILIQNIYEEIFESSPEAIVLIDKKGDIISLNPETERMFGYAAKELEGKTIGVLFPERFRSVINWYRNKFYQKVDQQILDRGKYITAKTKNGTELEVEMGFSLLAEGELAMASIRPTKISELQTKINKLSSLNKEWEQYIYITSHDLQEPIRTLISITDFFNNNYSEGLDSRGLTALEFINSAALKMQKLVVDLLDYSRLGCQKVFEPVDCKQLIYDIMEDLFLQINQSHTEIIVHDLPVIQGNSTELRLLFQNLIINSIKYAKKNVPPIIEIKAKSINRKWMFEVVDNGIGIEEKYFSKIFNIFQSLNKASDHTSSGIGLAHCKKVVNGHGGEIWVKSEYGQGSSFCLTIEK